MRANEAVCTALMREVFGESGNGVEAEVDGDVTGVTFVSVERAERGESIGVGVLVFGDSSGLKLEAGVAGGSILLMRN